MDRDCLYLIYYLGFSERDSDRRIWVQVTHFGDDHKTMVEKWDRKELIKSTISSK